MHKLHKYCKKHCDKVQPSKTTESVYYYFGDTEIRVSNHISVQNKINILIDSRSDNYILILKDYIPRILSYKEVKLWLQSLILTKSFIENKNILENYTLLKQQYKELNTKYALLKANNNVHNIRLMITGLSKNKQKELRRLYHVNELNKLIPEQLTDIYNKFPNWFK
jgi:hypothetical protein